MNRRLLFELLVATNFFLAPGAVGPMTVSSMLGRIALPDQVSHDIPSSSHHHQWFCYLPVDWTFRSCKETTEGKYKGFKTIGNICNMYVTTDSEIASVFLICPPVLICVLQLCFYIESPMGFHWCSCYCCRNFANVLYHMFSLHTLFACFSKEHFDQFCCLQSEKRNHLDCFCYWFIQHGWFQVEFFVS